MQKKTIKKVAALGVGALMLGATLGGALAQSNDLSNYPTPFVENGVLSNSVIVVGANAATADVLGAVDIAAALQAAAVSQQELEVGSSVAPTIDQGVKIEKSGDKMNFNEDIYDVIPEPLDDQDLPDTLMEGTYDDNEGNNQDEEDYVQELQFEDSAWTFSFTQPRDPEEMDAGEYLSLADNQRVYNYTLEFDSSVTYDTSAIAGDFEGTTLDLLGNTFTITQASGSAGVLNKLTFVAGDSTVWLVQDQPYTVGDNTITVVDVNEGETKCGINVDGVTRWVDDGDTVDFGDLSVGVLDVIAVNNANYDADTCEITLGSNEMVLENNQKIKVNGDELDGSTVTFTGSAGSWTGLVVRYQGGKEGSGTNADEIHLEAGKAWTDPVFGQWKVLFEGSTADVEMMELKASSDDATLTFLNNDGKEVEIPWHYDGGTFYLGTDTDEELLLPGEKVTEAGGIEGSMLLYTTSGGEAHVLEIDSVECDSSTRNETDITDVTYGNSYNDKEITCNPASWATVSLGSLGSVQLNLTATYLEYRSVSGYGLNTNGGIKTKYSETGGTGNLSFMDTGSSGQVVGFYFTERDGDETSENAAQTLTFNLTYDSSDTRVELQTPIGTFAAANGIDNTPTDDENKWYVTKKGTKVLYDSEDRLSLELHHPEKEVFANVFVAPLSASVTSGGSAGTVTADKVNPFAVGLAVLDSEAESMSKNMLVVGGPCVNTIAADLMGNPASCAEGFEPGKAMIKYFDRNGRAALLVAGYSAQDTRGASYVLADADSYDLSGDEVEVVVTSLSNIVVNPVV